MTTQAQSERITVTGVTAEEKEMAKWFADQHGMTLSAYIRMRMTEDPIERIS